MELTATGWALIGGKWATVGSNCVSRSCFATSSCGLRAFPARRCANLQAGISVAEVSFQLGQSQRVSGELYYWPGGKADNELIEARIVAGKLVSIDCNPSQSAQISGESMADITADGLAGRGSSQCL